MHCEGNRKMNERTKQKEKKSFNSLINDWLVRDYES
jgi:hypothetical protein